MESINTTALKACLFGVVMTLCLYLPLSSVAVAQSNTGAVQTQQTEKAIPAAPTSTGSDVSVRRAALQSNEPSYLQVMRDLWLMTAEQLGTESELYILPAHEFELALVATQDSAALENLADTPVIDWFVGLRTEQIEAAGLYQGPQLVTRDVSLFQRRHLPAIKNVEDATGFVIGVVEGSPANEWLSMHHPDLALRNYRDLQTMLDAALAGQLHVFAGPALLSNQLSATRHEHDMSTAADDSPAQRRARLSHAFPMERRLALFSEPLYLATRDAADADELAKALADVADAQQRYLQTQAARNMTSLVSLQQDELDWLFTQDSIVVGVPTDSRPILYFNSEGEAVGLDADFLALLSERSALSFSYSGCGNWEACLRALAERNIDVLTFVSNTPARREYAAFTSVYWETPWAIASAEAGLVRADRLEDIDGKRIAITRSYSLFEAAMEMPNLQVYPVDSPEDGMIAVLEGRADGYLDSLPLLVERVREQHTGNLYLTILHGQEGDAVSFAVRQDWPVLRDILDRTVQTLSEDDKQQIADRWFDVNFEQGLSFADVRRWIVYPALAMGALIIFFAFRNSLLRKEVARRKRAEKKMRHLARHDDLTGLPNRHLLDDRMKQVLASHQRHKRQFAVLFLDLDGFKEINDEHGHDVGDALLQQVATRLKDSLRAQDTVCRFGGDEFIVILTEQHNASQAMTVAKKLVERITEPYQLTSTERAATNVRAGSAADAEPKADSSLTAHVSVSVGVAMFPEHSDNGAELLRLADKAMYEVKREGKNGVRLAAGLE